MTGDGERARLVEQAFEDAASLFRETPARSLPAMLAAADAVIEALRGGHKVLACGNGGSAADAQHFVAELVGRFVRERPAWPALSLTTDTSVLTAVGNDYAFDRVFARQVEAHGQAGDVLVLLSTSGNSPNVLAAAAAARARGVKTIALTGRDGGALGGAVDVHLHVPARSTARVQEVHGAILHVLCELVERALT